MNQMIAVENGMPLRPMDPYYITGDPRLQLLEGKIGDRAQRSLGALLDAADACDGSTPRDCEGVVQALEFTRSPVHSRLLEAMSAILCSELRRPRPKPKAYLLPTFDAVAFWNMERDLIDHGLILVVRRSLG
jgi:hypothetical protein